MCCVCACFVHVSLKSQLNHGVAWHRDGHLWMFLTQPVTLSMLSSPFSESTQKGVSDSVTNCNSLSRSMLAVLRPSSWPPPPLTRPAGGGGVRGSATRRTIGRHLHRHSGRQPPLGYTPSVGWGGTGELPLTSGFGFPPLAMLEVSNRLGFSSELLFDTCAVHSQHTFHHRKSKKCKHQKFG